MNAKTSSRLPHILVMLLGGVLALGLGLWAASGLMAPAQLDTDALHGTYLPGGREVTEFELVDHDGQTFTREHLKGYWSLLFFGFTNCPDICPMTMLELGQALNLARENGHDTPLRGLFVTVDPARDTRQRLQDYVTAFDSSFLGLTGPLENIDVLARDLGIVHVRHGEPDDPDYMVDHGTAVLLINPEGQLQAILSAPHRAPVIAGDLAAIIAHHEGR
ncbi:MAG: SCO family protein [Ectothiorhodospiraceae bacterium]|nr:SCO family protein [Ectothiorhodospiraceae bacterium]